MNQLARLTAIGRSLALGNPSPNSGALGKQEGYWEGDPSRPPQLPLGGELCPSSALQRDGGVPGSRGAGGA